VLAERTSITENRHRWFVVMSRVRAARGDYEAANGLLDQAEALYRHGFYPDVRPIAAMRARVCIAAGDLVAATEWADSRGVSVSDDANYLREYEHLTLARLLLAKLRTEQHSDDAADATLTALLALLNRLYAAAAEAGRHGSVLEIRVLQALAHDAHGDLRQALAALSSALAEPPEPENYVRLYLGEREPMAALLQQMASETGPNGADEMSKVVRRRARRILDQAERIHAAELSQASSESMSQRELEVLHLLESDMTGPEIARQLYVTVNTLRTHTKHIFTKLDVRTRAAAITRARERGLL
jgi:LuxR family maltose regulon positive regulatory protein